jgi:tetratricopeptide (TPR) repeat protein
VLENLGRVHLESGRFREAIISLSEAYRLHLAQGHLLGQARTLRDLGKAQRGAGQPDKARESLEAALALFKNLEDATETDDISSALAKLPPGGRPSHEWAGEQTTADPSVKAAKTAKALLRGRPFMLALVR